MIHLTLNNGLDPHREHQHLHERFDGGERLAHAGGIIRPHGNDQVGWSILLPTNIQKGAHAVAGCVLQTNLDGTGRLTMAATT